MERRIYEVSRHEMEGNFCSPFKSMPSSGEIGAAITAQSYGLCYRLWFSLQRGSEGFMRMWQWAALKAVTKEDAGRRWEDWAGEGEGVRTGQKWKVIHFTEDHKTQAETGPLNKIKVTRPQLADQYRGSVTLYLSDWNTSTSPKFVSDGLSFMLLCSSSEKTDMWSVL